MAAPEIKFFFSKINPPNSLAIRAEQSKQAKRASAHLVPNNSQELAVLVLRRRGRHGVILLFKGRVEISGLLEARGGMMMMMMRVGDDPCMNVMYVNK